MESLETYAQRWLAADPDPVTRAELTALLDHPVHADRNELIDRFGSRLTFGTAGLRGALGAGPNRMNRLTVRAAAAGLGAFLDPRSTVVIGFDGRTNSEAFATDVAGMLAAAGHRALRFAKLGPTPLLAFAVRHLGADAGVMITASHNPPQDNGVKVYLSDGAQLVAPDDDAIEAHIGAALDRLEWLGRDLDEQLHTHEMNSVQMHPVELVGGDVAEAYLTAILAAVPLQSDPSRRARLRIVHTAMHGVATELALELLRRAGFTDVHSVPEQARPDPDFPTVAFPNPEEPGALDLALSAGNRALADVILANDPDADRLAVIVRAPADDPFGAALHGWRALHGNHVGWLLADHLSPPSVATTIVSSTLLRAMAQDRGWRYTETLTGFKWLARTGASFAYEEALGYGVTDVVHDKDGLSAALAFADLCAFGSPLQRLAAIEARYGRRRMGTTNVRDNVAELMAAARRSPHPETLAGQPVRCVTDLLSVDGGLGVTGLPSSDVVIVELGPPDREVARVVVRPSGTEPKAKIYFETNDELPMEALVDDVMRWLEP